MMLPLLIVVAQLIDTYIRWLAFSKRLSDEQNHKLWLAFLSWAFVSFIAYNFLFALAGVNAATYKFVLMAGWLPYFLISLRVSSFTQQIFIIGMGAILSLVQHTTVAIIILAKFKFQTDAELILTEATGYLLLFVIFLPLVRKYFMKLLPSVEILELRPIGMYIAMFPLVIVSGHLIRLADGVLVHSFEERLSRIYLPLVFLFLYRYVLNATKKYYEKLRAEQNKRRLEEQLTNVKSYNDLIVANQTGISVMRHDLRHNYNLISMMLAEGKINAALEHINAQKNKLERENE